MSEFSGERLIFIISQPRAGSTLLQRILAGHPDIHTLAEPWLLLPLTFALRGGYDAPYAGHTAAGALANFVGELPDGEADYFEGVRRMASHLYACALEGTGKRIFLDKTPRYYFIIPEIRQIFPDAKLVFLLRHPLAVLSSVFNSWTRDDWFQLRTFRHDVLDAPGRLVEGLELAGDDAIVVRYEALVAEPEAETRRLCERLGIPYMPGMEAYGSSGTLPKWRLGDQKSVYEHTRPVAGNAEKWIRALEDPQIWRLSHEYLQKLGRDVFDRLGYSHEEASAILEARRPPAARRVGTIRLDWLLADEPPLAARWLREASGFRSTARQYGLWHAVRAAGHRLRRR